MVNIKVKQEGARCALRMTGHADFNPGCDIVCAGCSAIVYALAGYLSNTMRERYVEVYKWKVKKGDAHLDFAGDARDVAAFEMALIGLGQAEKAYPDYVSISPMD